MIGLTVGVSALVAATVHVAPGSGQDPVRLGLTGIDVGQVAVAGLGVMVVAGEYTTGMIRTTLLAMPRRLAVLAGKAALLSGIVLATGGLAVLGCLLLARLLLPGAGLTPAHGYALVDVTDATTVRAAVGAVLYLVLIGLLGLGIATAVRDAATATGLVLGLLYLLPILASMVSDPDLAPAPGADRADDRRTGRRGHHQSRRHAAQSVGGPRRARRLGRGRIAARRRTAAGTRCLTYVGGHYCRDRARAAHRGPCDPGSGAEAGPPKSNRRPVAWRC